MDYFSIATMDYFSIGIYNVIRSLTDNCNDKKERSDNEIAPLSHLVEERRLERPTPRPERGALPTALLLDRKARGNPEKSLNVTLRNLLRCEQIYICQCIALP